MRALVVFSLSLCLAVIASARGDDNFGQDGCEHDWFSRLEGRTIYGLDLYDNSRFTEYMTADGRVVWTMDGLEAIQDDRWSIEQCELICWELKNFEDWCARLVDAPYGLGVYNRFTAEKMFEVIIGPQGDVTGLEAELSSQKSDQ